MTSTSRALLVQLFLAGQSATKTANVMLSANADAHFWRYDSQVPNTQICVSGTASRRGDWDAAYQTAVADDKATRLLLVVQASTNGEVEAVDACAMRQRILGNLFPQYVKDSKCSVSDFSRPFNKVRAKQTWLAGQVGTSAPHSQDYADLVTVQRLNVANKTLWASTLLKAFDLYFSAKHKSPLSLDDFYEDLPDLAIGMLHQVCTGPRALFQDFKESLRRSLWKAGVATIAITRQGEEAIAAWKDFCFGAKAEAPAGPVIHLEPVPLPVTAPDWQKLAEAFHKKYAPQQPAKQHVEPQAKVGVKEKLNRERC
jgi:hypothetical protein